MSRLADKMKVVGATAALLATLAYGGSAHAIVFSGNWDPAFGSPFPDLGWRGEATFFVPDACLALTGSISNSNPCSMSTMQLLNAEVDFYKVSDPTNPAFQETLSFDVPSSQVVNMDIENGMLTGLFGTFGYSRPATLPLAGSPYSEFTLFFQGDIARSAFEYDPPGDRQSSGVSDQPAFITFRVVPEPGSAALLGLGLGLLAVLKRRRSMGGQAQA